MGSSKRSQRQEHARHHKRFSAASSAEWWNQNLSDDAMAQAQAEANRAAEQEAAADAYKAAKAVMARLKNWQAHNSKKRGKYGQKYITEDESYRLMPRDFGRAVDALISALPDSGSDRFTTALNMGYQALRPIFELYDKARKRSLDDNEISRAVTTYTCNIADIVEGRTVEEGSLLGIAFTSTGGNFFNVIYCGRDLGSLDSELEALGCFAIGTSSCDGHSFLGTAFGVKASPPPDLAATPYLRRFTVLDSKQALGRSIMDMDHDDSALQGMMIQYCRQNM